MINKENVKEDQTIIPKETDGFVDIAKMDVQCHLIIKDKDTGTELVNKRG